MSNIKTYNCEKHPGEEKQSTITQKEKRGLLRDGTLLSNP